MTRYKTHKLISALVTLVLCVSCAPDQNDRAQAYAAKKGSYPINTHHLTDDGEPLFTNRLIHQSSLYLLQHAHNPVDWWSWGDDAFAEAKKLDKPILLSIGYSTCHWCHVMERESFENLEIAEFINQNFIPIKVDREEHPDVDELYITAVQKLSGQSGWPLTAVLTPEGLPFFGGTYFPPQKFLDLLQRVSSTWVDNREAILEQAERVRTSLQQTSKASKSAQQISADFTQQAQQSIAQDLARAGGPQAAFPREPEMLFVLRQAKHNLDTVVLAQLNRRLDAIAKGGIHDQLAGGFHRYTVDSEWQVPHFEKMLYNQAQLAKVYLLHYQLSADIESLAVAQSTLDFMLNEMQSKDGGFYAAMDAESEGAEGTYYLWSMEQLATLLTEQELSLAEKMFGVSERGNFEGKNVLRLNVNSPQFETPATLALKEKLLSSREQRVNPPTDTKIITAWNGLAISALVTAYETTGKSVYLDAAVRAADAIWQGAYHEKAGLARILTSERSSRVEGVLDDYANFSNALLDLYDQSGDQRWLDRSSKLADQMLQRYFNQSTGSFLTSSKTQNKNLIVDLISARDDALVSGNSMAAQLMMRLYRRTGLVDYRSTAKSVLAAFSDQILKYPHSLSGMLHGASLLNEGETGSVQYAAKSKVQVRTSIQDSELTVAIKIAPGWHINSYRVLESDLIASQLKAVESHCASIADPIYPADKKVSLGFQTDELLVFEGELNIQARIDDQTNSKCRLVAAQLELQACSDQVCMEPENLQLRALYPPSSTDLN